MSLFHYNALRPIRKLNQQPIRAFSVANQARHTPSPGDFIQIFNVFHKAVTGDISVTSTYFVPNVNFEVYRIKDLELEPSKLGKILSHESMAQYSGF